MPCQVNYRQRECDPNVRNYKRLDKASERALYGRGYPGNTGEISAFTSVTYNNTRLAGS